LARSSRIPGRVIVSTDWSREPRGRFFNGLLEPFRERGRRTTTIQVRAPRTFHDQTLWPEYRALANELDAHLSELTDRVIREAIHEDVTDAPESAAPRALPARSQEESSAESREAEGADGSPT
jgi:hypothetical protein